MRSRYDYRKPSRNYFLYIENARGPSLPSFLQKLPPLPFLSSAPFPFPSLSRRSLDHATTFFHPLGRAFNRVWAHPLTRRSQDDLSKLSHFAVHFKPRDGFAKYSWYLSTISEKSEKLTKEKLSLIIIRVFFSFIIANVQFNLNKKERKVYLFRNIFFRDIHVCCKTFFLINITTTIITSI